MSFNESSLTQNAISTLVNMQGGGTDRNFQPTIQILNLKNVGPGKSNESQDRWRVVLSDGRYFVQGMLATQLSSMVDSGQLQQYSMIRIQDFMNNKIQDRNIIIILRIEVLGTSDRKLGEPVDLQKAGGAAAVAPPGAAASTSAEPMFHRSNTAYTPVAAKGTAASGGSNPYVSPSNPYSPEKNRSSGGRAAPIVAHGTSPGGTPITLISQLNMYQNRWTIKARVVSKSDIRTWSNAKGEGSLFSVDFLDSSGMDIRATMFKESVDKYYPFLEVGRVYTISGGKIKVANVKFNTCKSQYEMTLDNNAQIALADDEGQIKEQSFDFTKIGDLEHVEAGKNVDIIAIVQEISEVQSLMSKKNGQELQKTDVTLIDDTGVQVRLTLWGAQAMNAQRDIGVHKAVAFRRVRVSDYGGVTLSGAQASFVEPKIPETQALQEWWSSQGRRAAPVKSLSSQGSGGKMDAFADRKTISDIKGKNLGYQSEKGDYICFKATFTFFKKDKEGGAWYTACPNTAEPCRSRCKVTQTTDGNWQCDRCQGTYPNCTRRWIFSGTVADDTASTWVSLFDEQALTLFQGATADDVFAQFENQDAYDGFFAKANFTEWNFKCRVKNEMVNDEPRVKTTIVRMDPVDYVAESRDILNQLEKWQL